MTAEHDDTAISPQEALDNARWLARRYRHQSLQTIADELGVSTSTVRRAMIRHGIARHGRGHLATQRISDPLLADRDWLIEHYEHRTQTAIAAERGVTVDTVRRALDVHGIERRPPGVGPRPDRPDVLDDPGWLAARYQTARTIREIAELLGVNEQMVNAALRRHGIPIRSEVGRHRDELVNTDKVLELVNDHGTKRTAEELGVSQPGVQRALQRAGHASPHRYEAKRLRPPPADQLQRWWQQESTIKSVARRCDVSVNTAAIWLAEVGIFVSDTPAISRAHLQRAIADGDTIDTIRRRHHVTGRTVIVELHRHHLFAAHRRRHLR